MTSAAFTSIIDQLRELDITSLQSYSQPNIEDASVYHFTGSIDGESFDFRVYGVLYELDDNRYHRIVSALMSQANDIQMREVRR